MNVLDLFSGIGGFSLGLERAGMRTVAFCERDAFCRSVLAKHWPGVPCFGDIHALDAGGLGGIGSIDLVCGGFPCQPFSVAGKQAAQQDDRHLWPEMRRVIALARPAWVVGENVAGIIPLALDDVLSDLEGLGYAARPFVIPACAVGARHRRDRVWIIARDTHGKSESIGPVDAGEVAELPSSIADALSDRLQGIGEGRDIGGAPIDEPRSEVAGVSRAADTDSFSGERPQRREIGRMGREESVSRNGAWPITSEPLVRRGTHGIPRRMDRLRALGNAVVPQIVEEIGRAIMATV